MQALKPTTLFIFLLLIGKMNCNNEVFSNVSYKQNCINFILVFVRCNVKFRQTRDRFIDIHTPNRNTVFQANVFKIPSRTNPCFFFFTRFYRHLDWYLKMNELSFTLLK